MQHQCNKSESSLQEILRHLWENTIDEILEDHGWDPQDAVELVEILIAVRAGDAKIELPLPILLAVLDWCLKNNQPRVRVVADSELMVKQMKGQYKVNSPDLRPLWEEARRRANQL